MPPKKKKKKKKGEMEYVSIPDTLYVMEYSSASVGRMWSRLFPVKLAVLSKKWVFTESIEKLRWYTFKWLLRGMNANSGISKRYHLPIDYQKQLLKDVPSENLYTNIFVFSEKSCQYRDFWAGTGFIWRPRLVILHSIGGFMNV